jgi:MYXO-CTERM domain-containing protein
MFPAMVARYTDLAAFDAVGVPRPAWAEVVGNTIILRVEDEGARYPLKIDPLMWTQQAKLTASDQAGAEYFGYSVSVDVNIAIIGAYNNTVDGKDGAGTAYVFVQSGSDWTQMAEITASDAAVDAYFGRSVSVSGDTAIVGAPYPTAVNEANGAAYIFALAQDNSWPQQAKLTASDGNILDGFGSSVSVSGNTAIVGAPYHQVGGKAHAGAAYVFVQNGTTWTPQAELTAADEMAGDWFGSSVSMSGDYAVIGAPNHAVGNVSGAGTAYVFVRNGTMWSQQAELTAIDASTSDAFGSSVSLAGSNAIVGAFRHAVGNSQYVGAAYVFVQNSGSWTPQAELTASDGAANDFFGSSVSVSAGTAVVGAAGHQVGGNTLAGAAYMFMQNGTSWTQQAELVASDGSMNNQFGSSVSVSRGTAMIGDGGYQVGNQTYVGAVYVFDFCQIGGILYVTGTENPSNACQVCTPATSTTAWSNQPDSTTCTDGTCQSGVCTPLPDAGADAGDAGDGGPGTTSSSSGSSSSGTTTSSTSGTTSSSSSTGTTSAGGSGAGGSGGASSDTNFYACAASPPPQPTSPVAPAAVGALLALGTRRRRRSSTNPEVLPTAD